MQPKSGEFGGAGAAIHEMRARRTAIAESSRPLASRNDLLLKSLKQHPMLSIAESPEKTIDNSVIASPEAEPTITKPRLAPFSLGQLQMTPHELEVATHHMPSTSKRVEGPSRRTPYEQALVDHSKSPPSIVGEDAANEYSVGIKITGRTITKQGSNERDSLQVQRVASETHEAKLRDQIISTIRYSQEKVPTFGVGSQDAEGLLAALLTSRQDAQRMPGGDHDTLSPRTLPGKEASMQETLEMTHADGSPLKVFNTLATTLPLAKKQESIETITAIPQPERQSQGSQRGAINYESYTHRRSVGKDNIVTELDSQHGG